MTRLLVLAVCVLMPISVALLASPTPAAACSRDAVPYARMPRHAHLIVIPSGRLVSSARHVPRRFASVQAPRGFDETIWQPGKRWWWEARIGRWFRRLRDRPPYGQLASVEFVGGDGSARLGRAPEVVIVYWNTDSRCGPALRLERAPALTPGERVFLTAILRDTAEWVAQLPTFDVTPEHFVHYEREYWKQPKEHDPQRMSAREVLSAYEALPEYETLTYLGSTTALGALRAWARSNPTLAARYPAQRMIANANRFALYADSTRRLVYPPAPDMP